MVKNSYPVNGQTVVFQGRTYDNEGIRCLSWTDSGFTICFEGTGVWAEMWTDQPHSDKSRPYIGILIDGEIESENMRVIAIDREGWNLYPLATSLSEGRHTLQLVKLSEAHHSIVKVKTLSVEGDLIVPPPLDGFINKRAIEFVGDSITAGYGVSCKLPDGPFCTKEEDGWISYAALTARRLNARFSIVAHSGWCIYKSPYGNRMPDIYEYTYDNEEKWDFSSNPNDLVVVNLGTNDSAWIRTLPENEREEHLKLFMDAYVDFIKKIRLLNPGAKILCVIGMVNTLTEPYVERAVETATAQGISDVYFGRLPRAVSYGAGHPSAESHVLAADALEKIIKEVIER